VQESGNPQDTHSKAGTAPSDVDDNVTTLNLLEKCKKKASSMPMRTLWPVWRRSRYPPGLIIPGKAALSASLIKSSMPGTSDLPRFLKRDEVQSQLNQAIKNKICLHLSI